MQGRCFKPIDHGCNDRLALYLVENFVVETRVASKRHAAGPSPACPPLTPFDVRDAVFAAMEYQRGQIEIDRPRREVNAHHLELIEEPGADPVMHQRIDRVRLHDGSIVR